MCFPEGFVLHYAFKSLSCAKVVNMWTRIPYLMTEESCIHFNLCSYKNRSVGKAVFDTFISCEKWQYWSYQSVCYEIYSKVFQKTPTFLFWTILESRSFMWAGSSLASLTYLGIRNISPSQPTPKPPKVVHHTKACLSLRKQKWCTPNIPPNNHNTYAIITDLRPSFFAAILMN